MYIDENIEEEINFDCPKCGNKECIELKKRTYAITSVPLKKIGNTYYTDLRQDFERYGDTGHIPVSNWYEAYILSCWRCNYEVEWRSEESFSEYLEEIDENFLIDNNLISEDVGNTSL
jgi:hypothetical protein